MLQIFDELDGESTSDDSGLPDIPSGDEGVPAPVVHEIGDSPRSPSITADKGVRDDSLEHLFDSDATDHYSESSESSHKRTHSSASEYDEPHRKKRFTVSIFN